MHLPGPPVISKARLLSSTRLHQKRKPLMITALLFVVHPYEFCSSTVEASISSMKNLAAKCFLTPSLNSTLKYTCYLQQNSDVHVSRRML